MICWECKTREIESKRRPLCKLCYSKLRKEGKLNQHQLMQSLNIVDTLTEKYGQSIIDDLRNIKESNLRIVGDKYGFSREYTRQIFEKLFGYRYTVIKNQKIFEMSKDKQEISVSKRNPYNKVVKITNKECNIYKGALIEKKVCDICALLNYTVTPYPNKTIDLVINGLTVDVKSSYRPSKTTQKQRILSYHFSIKKSQMAANFIICCCVPLNKFFVIPNSAFPLGMSIYIPEIERTVFGKNHWYQYLEAWHLLANKPPHNICFTPSDEANASSLGQAL